MVHLAVLALLLVLALGFAVTSSRAISLAGRAEDDTAARHRFLAAFDARAAGARVPADLLVQTFDTLSRRLPQGCPLAALRPDGRLAADLGLTTADVEDVALLVAARCEATLPQARDLDRLAREVGTVAELVRFLAPFVEAPGAAVRAA